MRQACLASYAPPASVYARTGCRCRDVDGQVACMYINPNREKQSACICLLGLQALIETFVVVGVACIAYPAQQTESGDSEFTIHTRLVIYYTTGIMDADAVVKSKPPTAARCIYSYACMHRSLDRNRARQAGSIAAAPREIRSVSREDRFQLATTCEHTNTNTCVPVPAVAARGN